MPSPPLLRSSPLLLFLGCGSATQDASPPKPPALAVPLPERDETETADPAPGQPAHRPPCDATPSPAPRRQGGLVVDRRPPPPERSPTRLRSHIDGALSRGATRTWVGPPVPRSVPLLEGSSELFLLDPGADGLFAVFRDPYGGSSCTLGGPRNCDVFIMLFGACGEPKWALYMGEFLSMPDNLEIQDIQLVDSVVYFNEACQSYSAQAGGRCSSLIALDPAKRRVLWRTPPLISNNRFLVLEHYIVAGYGFTAEPDRLHVVRRRDGRVLEKKPLPTAHEAIERAGEDMLVVSVYGGRTLRFRMVGFDGDSPKLVQVP